MEAKDHDLLTLIARVAVGERTVGSEEYLDGLCHQISDPVVKGLATDIVARNYQNESAARYLNWAKMIRRGAGNSQRERQKVLALATAEGVYRLDKEVRRLHNEAAVHRKRGFKLNDTNPSDVSQRLVDEAKELRSEYAFEEQNEAAKLEEAADVLLVFLHLIQMSGWTVNQVVERAFVKLKDIFPGGYSDTEHATIEVDGDQVKRWLPHKGTESI